MLSVAGNVGEQRRFNALCPLTKDVLEVRMATDIIIPKGAKAIPLNKDAVTIVDEADYEWLSKWKWRIVEKGYAQRSVAKHEGLTLSALFMHRVILNTPKGLFSDHINGNKLDNRRSNLRICTHHQNNLNRPNVTGKYKGVYWCKRQQRWMAQIMKNQANIYVGSFHTPEEAALAYNEAAKEYHGEFARLNCILDN